MYGNTSDRFYRLNLENLEWEEMNPEVKLGPRSSHTMLAVNNNFFMFSGVDEKGRPCTANYYYEIEDQKWSVMEGDFTGTFNHEACVNTQSAEAFMVQKNNKETRQREIFTFNPQKKEFVQIMTPKTEFGGMMGNNNPISMTRDGIFLLLDSHLVLLQETQQEPERM